MKIKSIKKFFFVSLGFFFLSFNCETVFANGDTSCRYIHSGICNVNGNVYIINPSQEITTKEGSLSSTSNDVVVGNLKFKFLKCHASEDKVGCDIQVYNPTSIDRTLFIASKQKGGIRSTAFDGLGITTMIDANGASYPADTVLFANHSGGETGQSNFKVYSKTPTKLSVIFTGVESPATISRLELSVGENTSSGLIYDRIKFPIKLKG
ncbi:MAG: hypothetical protein ACYTXE_27825 [Nostoc sp.]